MEYLDCYGITYFGIISLIPYDYRNIKCFFSLTLVSFINSKFTSIIFSPNSFIGMDYFCLIIGLIGEIIKISAINTYKCRILSSITELIRIICNLIKLYYYYF